MVSTFTDYSEKINLLLRKNLELEGALQQLQSEALLKESRAQKRQNYLLFALFLTPLSLLFVHAKRADYAGMNLKVQQSTAEIAAMQETLTQLSTTQTHVVKYITQPGDNLAKIGQLFFNDAKAGFRIAEDNHLHKKNLDYLLFPNDTLKIIYR